MVPNWKSIEGILIGQGQGPWLEEQTKQRSLQGIGHCIYRSYDENTAETWIHSNATSRAKLFKPFL
jgi:hypothetical protein